METLTIGFIGGGNMARSLIGGMLAAGHDPARICVADPDPETRERLAREAGICVYEDNQRVVEACDVVVLAVKPQVLKSVATALEPGARPGQLFLTVAAGIRTESLERWLGGEVAIVRAMPNTPALVQAGASALYATPRVSGAQREAAESILRAVGLVQWIEDEDLMDTVTALSGSGPAYFFLVMEAMEQAAAKLGLPLETARLLTVQTAFGAAKLALEIEEEPAVLRENVTSPGGTTEAALKTLQAGGLEKLFEEAITAARDRAVELAEELGN